MLGIMPNLWLTTQMENRKNSFGNSLYNERAIAVQVKQWKREQCPLTANQRQSPVYKQEGKKNNPQLNIYYSA